MYINASFVVYHTHKASKKQKAFLALVLNDAPEVREAVHTL